MTSSCDCQSFPQVDKSLATAFETGRKKHEKETGLLKAGVLVFDSKGRILLQQSYGNKWGLAKGTVHDLSPQQETPRSAAIRELEEETGLYLPKDELKILTDFYICKTEYVFYQALLDNNLSSISPGMESTAVAWVCPLCFSQKLKDQSGMRGIRAINWASRIALDKMKLEFEDHVVTNRWNDVLFGDCKQRKRNRILSAAKRKLCDDAGNEPYISRQANRAK